MNITVGTEVNKDRFNNWGSLEELDYCSGCKNDIHCSTSNGPYSFGHEQFKHPNQIK